MLALLRRSERVAVGAARRLASARPRWAASRLRAPSFVLGFNNSGKSTVTRLLRALPDTAVYPSEGNAEVWFPGLFPWAASRLPFPPIWYDPELFTAHALARHDRGFLRARAMLGAYQAVCGTPRLVCDSGMAGALASSILEHLPDARIVHFRRDGRMASAITAQLEWAAMLRNPHPYHSVGVPFDFSEVLERMGRYWAWTVHRLDELQRATPDRVITIDYEQWQADPGTAADTVARFIGTDLPLRPPPTELRVDLAPAVLSFLTPSQLARLDAAVALPPSTPTVSAS